MMVTDLPLWPDHPWKVPPGIEVRRGTAYGEDMVAFWDGRKHVLASLNAFRKAEGWKVALRNMGYSV